MALSSVSVVLSSLLLNLYTPPGALAWHEQLLRGVLTTRSWLPRRFYRVRLLFAVFYETVTRRN
jgi:hypothetical protein